LKQVEDIEKNVTFAFSKINLKPVVYDLSNKFDDGDNEWPFQRKKSNFPGTLINDINGDTLNEYTISIQKSEVCLDNQVFSTLFFWDSKYADKCNH